MLTVTEPGAFWHKGQVNRSCPLTVVSIAAALLHKNITSGKQELLTACSYCVCYRVPTDFHGSTGNTAKQVTHMSLSVEFSILFDTSYLTF